MCTSQQLMDDWFLEMAFVHKVCMCVSVFPPPRAFTWMDLLKKFSIQFQESKFILRTPVSYVLSTYPFIMILSRLGSLINSWYMRMEVESAISSKLPTKEILQYVTGFAKRDLPHTSNFMHLKDCNLLVISGMNLKFSHNVLQCFSSL